MRKTLLAVCRVITIIQVLLMTLMLVVMNALVLTRYLFDYSAPWTEEVTCYSMVWMVMLGAGVLTLFNDHIGWYMLVESLSPPVRYWQRLFAQTLAFSVGVIVTWTGFNFALSMRSVEAPALQINQMGPALAVPIGAVLITLFSGLRIALLIAEKVGGKKIELVSQAEFMDSSFKPAK
ncbi:TRAP transporter small permease [Desulfosarcina ovata]|uniref:Tripartite ATP-independent periplasmic transporters DctQ component domain-containing protein n=2 Tax=Desulfosarcina ovata TaxID=83564 RepID=A0A5K8AJZ3_9BACT|nr:TRAP transporter small permease [Desulfosarcina ovata]BBO85228.1 hypothetical protein DSCO28_57940 [Desulfosarcina ovata subsp. sediminis]BBO92120.1 hypothetical protein DSCOOX_53000 [Desulfosarcina ovata subsp. ovata]